MAEVKQDEVLTPEVETVETPVVDEAPAETLVEETLPDAEETPAVADEDRSAYNCPDCKGEGLQDQFHVCPNCGGTGKV